MRADTPPAIARRSTYEVAFKQEMFIVPLIRLACESAISNVSFHTRSGSPPRPLCAIDVGCGNQPLRPLVESAGYRYESLDVAQNAVGNVDHIGALDDELPLTLGRGERFDLVICTEVLEHVADWNRAFKSSRFFLKAPRDSTGRRRSFGVKSKTMTLRKIAW